MIQKFKSKIRRRNPLCLRIFCLLNMFAQSNVPDKFPVTILFLLFLPVNFLNYSYPFDFVFCSFSFPIQLFFYPLRIFHLLHPPS